MIANLLIAGAGILLVAAIPLLTWGRSMRRTRQMRVLAGQMDWSFEAQPALDIVPDRKRLGLFTVRMHQRMRNHLSGTMGEYRVAVFDLRYSTTRGEGIEGSEQTVVHVHSPRLHLPAFALRPEAVFRRSGDRVEADDIDFGADPEFSRAYQLRGRDESAIRDAFGADVRAAFRRIPGTSADADGADLLVWRRGELARPEDVGALVRAAVNLATHLRDSADYQIVIKGRTNGNHALHVAARRPPQPGKQEFYDLF
jgi:hypothetical protein